MKKVLVANRGEIAVRIIKTLKRMGIASVAVASEADRHAEHVRLADECVLIGPSPVSESYLNIQKIVEAMLSTGADGVHPGYGLLSENPAFIDAIESHHLIFIGPRKEHLESFGLKDRARELAQESKVPLVPGTPPLESLDSAIALARSITYPIMLKAAAGGGGIGMLRCENEDDLIRGFRSVTDMAINNFGNGSVFLEKCIDRARHVEVQVFGDGQGRVLSLGTRDCSLQRRNQKVVEETPAPNLSDDIRQHMESAAVALCSKHRYRSAGTVEYIYDCDREQFYFLEVNTRLQVEHTVTEEVYGIDLVEWMIRCASKDFEFWPTKSLLPQGHAFQARIYAEDPTRDFQPSTGEISHFSFGGKPRIDTWVRPGTKVTPYYDPLLAKVIVHGPTRESALESLTQALGEAVIGGIQSNVPWLHEVIQRPVFKSGPPTTKFVTEQPCLPSVAEVIKSGVQTTVQDVPGRVGMWNVGVPPSGPMDAYSFRLGNRLLDNEANAAGLECVMQGPQLKFHRPTRICITGADAPVTVDGEDVPMWTTLLIKKDSTLNIGKIGDLGARTYLLVDGGFQTPIYLGSRSTFTLGKFGGHCGRPLLPGDTIALLPPKTRPPAQITTNCRPPITHHWEVRVTIGPHTAPEFFTSIDNLLEAKWKVHFNSDRTGIRLIGPQPLWAREDGGEAGLHPSNIHDNAYAIGAMDFTGDQPVLLGPDGPSLGGFVCPITTIKADLWKMGQLSSDDTISFIPVSQASAESILREQELSISKLEEGHPITIVSEQSPAILDHLELSPDMVIRQSGDGALLCEFGELKLDLELRIHVHFFMEKMNAMKGKLYSECTPGIRSIQFQFDPVLHNRSDLIEALRQSHRAVALEPPRKFRSRVIHLPLSWDDPSTRIAIEKYVTSVRPNAPWCCPNNIEFIRRANGLHNVDEVKEIVYNASYLVMGLGDVYLGAPVAVPLDPRHRLVTTKYNPARTWTPENAVGIGGAYLCIYGMEGPGGYQFVGRTLPVWNRFRSSETFEEPYLLRFFDQIQFYEVSPEALLDYREAFLADRYHIEIEEKEFDVLEYKKFLKSIEAEATLFKQKQSQAFEEEKQRWIDDGVFNFDADSSEKSSDDTTLPPGAIPIQAPLSGAVWKVIRQEGDTVTEDDTLIILEAMKMEMNVVAPAGGVFERCYVEPGQTVQSGQCLGYLLP